MITAIVPLLDKILVGKFEVFDLGNTAELLIRFVLNLSVILILVRWLYYGTARRKDYLFTYILISTIIFLICYLLESVKLETGFALGLFAIFGIIRYRTSQMPIKEMTYLFIVIGISVINALANKKISILEIVIANLIIIAIIFGFEKIWLLRHESAKMVTYDRIDLIKPEKYNEMIADLQERTGIASINRVEVGKIDFLRDACRLTIYYYETGRDINQANIEDISSESGDDD
jgi:hypothetical protein